MDTNPTPPSLVGVGITYQCDDALSVDVTRLPTMGDAGKSSVRIDGQMISLLIVALLGAGGASGDGLANPFPHIPKA